MRRKFLLAMMVLSLLFGAMGGVGYLCAHNGGYPNVASGINDDETKDAVSISTYEGLKEALQTSGNYQLTADITVVVDNEIVLESICVAKIGETSYSTLQEAINAVQNSETITLLEDCAEQISFTQTADKSFVIDGNQRTMTGNFNITARAGKDALSTLEIKNFNFVTAESSYDFIKSVETNYYPNNITISGCTFKGTSDINAEGYAVVAVRLKSANNITIKNCTAEGLHSFLQNTAGWNISINNVDITNSLSGLACGTVQGINVKECEITTKGFGIRLDAQYNNNAVIESNKIEAFIPVVVRKASVVSSLTFNGINTMTQTNTDGIWCAIGTTEYETNGTMPTDPTGQVTVTLNDTGLSIDGVYGECHKFAGEGTVENPYLINNVYELKYFRDQVNSGNDYNGKYIQLNADIDLDDENWIGIGSAEHGFMGNFDGKEHTIKNLNIVETEAKEGKAYIGLFGYAKNTTIKNVTFDNVNLNIACMDIDHSQGHIGAVAGSLEGTSTIENVTVKGDVKVEATFDANGASRVAVVAGGNSYGDVTMKNVHVIANEGSYLKANNNVGALAGQLQNKSVFENCSSNIDVTGKKFFAGGIIGLAACDQTFTNCSTTGNVTITAGREGRANDHYRVGGIAGGWSDGKTNVCTLTKCTYTGTISGTNADGSVAYPLDYAGYVGRGYTLTNCAGSKVIIGSVEYVQAYNDKFGIYYVDGKLTINTADALKVVAENSSESVDIVLGSDITLTETIKINAGQTRTTDNVVTIDLNGNTITGTDNKETGSFGLIEIQPGAELIINDSSEDKSGKITLTATCDRDWNAYSSVISNQRGKLTVNGGTIEHLGGTDMAYAIDNLTNGKGTYAETIISGGTIKSTYRAIRQFLNGTEAQNILTVNGGTIEGTNKSIWMQEANASANPGTLTVDEASVVKGDILLSPAAGATEWPVVVSIAEAALEDSSTVLTNDNVPTGYDLQLVDGVYGVYSVVALIGDVKYTSLQAAVDAAQDGETVLIHSKNELSETVVVAENKNIIIDLNGKEITMSSDKVATNYAINNKGTLTLKDSSEDKTGAINARGIYNGYDADGNYITTAKIIVESGNYNAKGTNGGAAIFNYGIAEINGGNFTSIGSYSLNNQAGASMTIAEGVTANNGIYNTGATLTIDDGDIDGNRSGCHVVYAWNSNVIINDGDFYNNNSSNSTLMAAGTTTMTVNGGTFGIADGRSVQNWTSYLTDTQNTASMIVKGGTFNGGFRVQSGTTMTIEGGSFNDCYGSGYAINGTAVVKGGTYTDAAAKTFAQNYLADGYLLDESTGTVVDDPVTHYIYDLAGLKAFRDEVNAGANYKGVTVYLSDDIDLNEDQTRSESNWTPIGNSTNKFQGTFDGQNKTISNLVINGGSENNQGFFGYTTDGEIKNLTIENAKVSGRLNVGVVAGTPYTSKYTNIKVTGHVEVNGMAYVGGVGGKNAYANWTDITVDVDETSYVKAVSTENGTAYRTYVGGVIGFNGEGGHTFTNISSNIKVIGDVKDIGGIFGILHYNNKAENITFTGSVEAPAGAKEVGGIAGVWYNKVSTSVTINNVTSTGTVTIGEETTTGSIVGGAYNASNDIPSNSGSLVINGEPQYPYVAEIGDAKYATLQAAVNAAAENSTITFLDNIEQADGVIVADKKIIIDLAEKTFTVTEGASTNNRNFKINGASVVTIQNGTMVAKGDYSSGAYGTVRTEGTANVTLTGLKLYNYRGNGLNIKALDGTTVAIDNTEIYSQYGGGIEAAGGTITLAETVKVEQKGMYTSPWNSMAISVNSSGKVTVNGGTYFTECITAEEAYNQGTSHGPWVVGVLNSGGTLIINNGTFSNDNYGDNTLATNARGAVLADTKAVVEINGGTFNALKAIIDIQNNLGDANNNPSATLAGGTFSADPRTSASYSNELINVKEGYVVVENTENSTWTVQKGVAQIGDKYYATLPEAIAAAQHDDVVIMHADVAISESQKITKNITLNLNGNTITGTDNKETGSFGLIEIQPGAELIINDSSEDKSGKITLTATCDRDWNAYSSVISNQRGKLTVNGGTIEHLGGTDMAYAIDNLTNGKGTYAETIINGGTIKSTYRAIRQFLNGTESQNILTVNGGTIEGTNKSIWMQEANASANPGTLKVYETSVVKGDILLSPAAGATEWPVEVSIAAVALKDSSTVLTNDNVPTGYDLQLVDGVYGVYSVVAKIGDVKYQTLQEAFNAVADNGTITVLSDVTITSATACVNGSWIDGVKYTGDKSFTVDFGGYTITDDGCINDYLIYINNMGEKASEITFQNGTIVASNGCWATVCVNGNSSTQKVVLNLKGMNITNSNDASYSGNEAVRARNLATINVNDGTTITSNGASYGITAHAGGIVNIEEKATIEQKNSGTSGGNSVFAAVGGNGQVNIKGGTIISDRYGVHTMTSGTPVVNISGGTITALVALKASTNGGSGELATINVSAGTITGALETYSDNAHIILTGGIYTVNPSNYVAEHYAAKELGGNLWTVVQIYGTQTRELACAGWYWFSTYIQHDDAEAALDALQTTLGTNASTIKGQHGFTQYLNHNGTNFWSSGLAELLNSQMYMIKTKADNVAVELTGNIVDYETSGIELNDGWNWISYPVNQEMNLSDVISSDDLKDGDIIKSQFNGSATYYENHQLANGNVITGWIGDLKVMKPGFGYMFKSASKRTFNYTTSGNNSKSSLNTIDYNGDNHWFADATQYPNNMTMIAMLSIDGETVNGNYEVAAFANGECRGSARPIYIEALDAHVLYMTIHGEDMAELTFKYYDVNYGTEYELANRVTYSDHAVIGSLDEPYMLTLNITDIDELSLNEINIYPNPTTTGSEINLQAVCDKVEVYNSLGVKVAEYHNVDSIDALETAGIYVIRITDNGDVKHCRLVVK